MKCIGSYNGSNEFDNSYSYHGIHREKKVPVTPQENGASKRMNRTIMEHARCMRLHVGFPLQFWVDDVDTIVYLINRGPSSSLDGGMPEEAWTSKKVNNSFLRTFGCEEFVHIDKENRTTIEAKFKKCTFTGYGVNDLVISCMIMKTIKSLGVKMWYSIRRSCIKIGCKERNGKRKTHNTQ